MFSFKELYFIKILKSSFNQKFFIFFMQKIPYCFLCFIMFFNYCCVNTYAQKLSEDEKKLYDLLMAYRKSKGLPNIPLSPSLTIVAQTHVKDLQENRPDVGECNGHSWSNKGKWTSCCYTKDHKKAECMWSKPRELTSYQGNGFEIACQSETYVSPESSLKGWQGSILHNNVIINQGSWKNKNWKAIGVGMYQGYSAVWFGAEKDEESKEGNGNNNGNANGNGNNNGNNNNGNDENDKDNPDKIITTNDKEVDTFIEYIPFFKDEGWGEWASRGNITGAKGKIITKITVESGNKLRYMVYDDEYKWTNWLPKGTNAIRQKGIQAMRIELLNEKRISLKYRVMMNGKWQNWVNGGEIAGNTKDGIPIEAIQIKLE